VATLESGAVAVVGVRVRANRTSPRPSEAAMSTPTTIAAPAADRLGWVGATSGGREVATAIDTVAFEL